MTIYHNTLNPVKRKGLTLLDIVIALVIGAVLVATAFVSYQQIFSKAKEHAELASLKSVAREAQALLALSGADRWDQEAGLEAVLGALDDWPHAATSGIYADDNGVTLVEGDVWPGVGELAFTRSMETLALVANGHYEGWCVVVAPPTGPVYAGCIETLGDDEPTPREAINAGLVPHVTLTASPPVQESTTTTEANEDTGYEHIKIVAGGEHTCLLEPTGQAWCWGRNGVGNGVLSSQPEPQQVSGNNVFTSLGLGDGHSCGLDDSLKAWCWGGTSYGQVGNGTDNTSHKTPVKVSGNRNFKSIDGGASHTCALVTSGEAWCWGKGGNGQLGDGNNLNRTTPRAVSGGHLFESIGLGDVHSCGLNFDGDAYCWGQNNFGQLGNGNTSTERSPSLVAGDHTFVSITGGERHTCALDNSGKAWCWGRNESGQLGTGDNANTVVPTLVTGNHTFALIDSGSNHTCALDTSGTVWCWGSNESGQLGTGDNANQYAPNIVSGDHAFNAVTSGYDHVCGVTTAGDIYCWGKNNLGQLGNGNQVDQGVPVPVVKP